MNTRVVCPLELGPASPIYEYARGLPLELDPASLFYEYARGLPLAFL
jgi:hypothetical protein